MFFDIESSWRPSKNCRLLGHKSKFLCVKARKCAFFSFPFQISRRHHSLMRLKKKIHLHGRVVCWNSNTPMCQMLLSEKLHFSWGIRKEKSHFSWGIKIKNHTYLGEYMKMYYSIVLPAKTKLTIIHYIPLQPSEKPLFSHLLFEPAMYVVCCYIFVYSLKTPIFAA